MFFFQETIWISASILSLLALLIVVYRINVSLRIGHINPMTIYLSVWLIIYLLYNIRLVSFNEVFGRTWGILLLSHLMFTLGGINGVIANQYHAVSLGGTGRDEKVNFYFQNMRYQRVMAIYFLTGLMIFSYYIWEITSKYGGISDVITMPWLVRGGIGEREIGHSYKYIYLMMPLSVISSLYLLTNNRNILAWVILVVSLMSSVATTGRSNFVWCLVWIAMAIIYSKRISRVGFRMVINGALLFIFSVSVFVIMGNWLGKSYESSELGSEYQNHIKYLVLPYMYLEGSIPALQVQIESEQEKRYGENTFMPIAKIYSYITGKTPPNEIEEFVEIPILFNTSTYLSPCFRDFGLIGILIIPLFYGFASMYCFSAMWAGRGGIFLIYLSSLVSSIIVFSFGTNKSISFATWMFVFSGYIFFTFVGNRMTILRLFDSAPSHE